MYTFDKFEYSKLSIVIWEWGATTLDIRGNIPHLCPVPQCLLPHLGRLTTAPIKYPIKGSQHFWGVDSFDRARFSDHVLQRYPCLIRFIFIRI